MLKTTYKLGLDGEDASIVNNIIGRRKNVKFIG